MNLLNTSLEQRLIFYIPLLLSLSVHEWAHAAMAYYLGDDTAKLLGRMTFNPLAHIDPLGTLFLPLIGIPFAWAKPVPFNPVKFNNNLTIRKGKLLVALAGPVSNLFIAIVCFLSIKLFRNYYLADIQSAAAWVQLIYLLLIINISLALFNLLPIPPLDGSQILDSLIPESLRKYWNIYCSNGHIILILFLLLPILARVNIISTVIFKILNLIF